MANYAGVGVDVSGDNIVAMMPAGGWWIEWPQRDGTVGVRVPLVGWGLTASGEVMPLACDSDGVVETVQPGTNDFRVFHQGAPEVGLVPVEPLVPGGEEPVEDKEKG